MLFDAILLYSFSSAVLAQPLDLNHLSNGARPNLPLDVRTTPLTVAGLTTIAPTSTTCTGALFPSECRTATQSLPHITASFAKYNITHAAVQAALVSLMAYESGEFRYNVNHWPGVLGQGTRNMQSAAFKQAYARDLGFGPDVVDSTAALMGAVGADEYSFASAAWFVVTQCQIGAREGMWGGGREGWERYLTECVGTTVNNQRAAYWERAMRVFGVEEPVVR